MMIPSHFCIVLAFAFIVSCNCNGIHIEETLEAASSISLLQVQATLKQGSDYSVDILQLVASDSQGLGQKDLGCHAEPSFAMPQPRFEPLAPIPPRSAKAVGADDAPTHTIDAASWDVAAMISILGITFRLLTFAVFVDGVLRWRRQKALAQLEVRQPAGEAAVTEPDAAMERLIVPEHDADVFVPLWELSPAAWSKCLPEAADDDYE